MTNKLPDPWGLRDILNGTDTPKWWEVHEKFRRWNQKRRAKKEREQDIRLTMEWNNCDYTEAVRAVAERDKHSNDKMDDLLHDMNINLLGTADDDGERKIEYLHITETKRIDDWDEFCNRLDSDKERVE